jgi:hypothetical protein
MGSDEKAIADLIEDSFYMCVTSLLVLALYQFNYDMSKCGSLQDYCIWILLNLLDVSINMFYHIWGGFNHYSDFLSVFLRHGLSVYLRLVLNL